MVHGVSLVGAAACNRVISRESTVREAPIHPLQGALRLDGQPWALPTLQGQVTVIDFWASWCSPCREAFPFLDNLYRRYVGNGLQVFGLSVDKEAKPARAFAARMQPQFALAWDPDGVVSDRFGVQQLPTTILLDQSLRMVHRNVGFTEEDHRRMELAARDLLNIL